MPVVDYPTTNCTCRYLHDVPPHRANVYKIFTVVSLTNDHTEAVPGDAPLKVVDLRLDAPLLFGCLVTLELQSRDLFLKGLHHNGNAAEIDLGIHPLL